MPLHTSAKYRENRTCEQGADSCLDLERGYNVFLRRTPGRRLDMLRVFDGSRYLYLCPAGSDDTLRV